MVSSLNAHRGVGGGGDTIISFEIRKIQSSTNQCSIFMGFCKNA